MSQSGRPPFINFPKTLAKTGSNCYNIEKSKRSDNMKMFMRLLAGLSAAVMLSSCVGPAEENIHEDALPSVTSEAPSAAAATTTAATTTAVPATAAPTTTSEPPVTLPPEPEFYRVNILCAGDNLVHSSIYNQAARRAKSNGETGYDFSYPYEKIEKYVAAADLAILNQETIVTDDLEPSDYPRFCSPAALGEHMIDIGFDVFSMSNNHVLDRGEEGLISCLDFWDSHPEVIRYGAYRDEADMENIRLKTVNNITFAFLGYMEHTNGLSLPADSACKITYLKELDIIEAQIKRAKELADVVVVSPHFGVEVSNEVTEQQYMLAQKFVDWGADLIIGTQPHTAQTLGYVERADGTKGFCFYCLGNLISSMDRPLAMVGILGSLDVLKNSQTGEISFENIKAIPIIDQYGEKYYQVHVVPYAEYTEADLRAHGCKGFTQETIDEVLENIPEEYLAIE